MFTKQGNVRSDLFLISASVQQKFIDHIMLSAPEWALISKCICVQLCQYFFDPIWRSEYNHIQPGSNVSVVHFCSKLRVLMVELNIFHKNFLFVTIYSIFQIRSLKIQYSQFGTKMYTLVLCSLGWNFRARLQYENNTEYICQKEN